MFVVKMNENRIEIAVDIQKNDYIYVLGQLIDIN